MRFKTGLIRARSHIAMILGLVVASGIALLIEFWDPRGDAEAFTVEQTHPPAEEATSPLTQQEKEWAQIAWRYFENNLVTETGLVNSVDGYPSTTLWDTGSYLMALISAYRLHIIDREMFDQRLSAALDALRRIPLFDGHLPNKAYHTRSLTMVTYGNEETARGIGWSAIDIGRVLVPFNVIAWNYPEHTMAVRKIISRWNLKPMLKDGVLYGAILDDEMTVHVQEGRIGYEKYSAKSFALIGGDVRRALEYRDFLKYVDVYGIQIPTDRRSPLKFRAHNYVVSEPYILDGLEFGWDEIAREFAFRVYRAQKERYRRTGKLTAVSEDHIDRPPYFVYNTVFADGKTWNCITDRGEDASEFKTVSTKAAFGWHVLYRTPYTRQLVERVSDLYDPAGGWYSGLYEKTNLPNKVLTCNTNGIVLEALCYKALGKHLDISLKGGSADEKID